jgi:2',3'-cyclic-nucleotide 2'-phosphodiesterase (5'-nucleotidase family)
LKHCPATWYSRAPTGNYFLRTHAPGMCTEIAFTAGWSIRDGGKTGKVLLRLVHKEYENRKKWQFFTVAGTQVRK